MTQYPTEVGQEYVIAETDGSLVPTVEIDEEVKDQRKGKKHAWKAARRCLAHALGKLTLYFGAEFKAGVDEVGQIWFDCASHAGFGRIDCNFDR
jgi:non-canonical (house-cleaning) NTP pyrophosphatase